MSVAVPTHPTGASRPIFLGIEIGGTKLQLGLGPGDGTLLALERRTIVPDRGAGGIRDQILEAVPTLLANASSRGIEAEVAAVGVGFGGPVDAGRGRVTTSHQVGGWDDFPLADWLAQSLGVRTVAVENDADTAGLAEARAGAGRGSSPLLYVTIGSGIGGGLILDGQIYRGAGFGAAEIGHLYVPDADRNLVSLETVASGWGIQRTAGRRVLDLASASNSRSALAHPAGGSLTTKDVAEAARLGNPVAVQILREAANAFAFGLAQALTLFAPRRIVLGGGVSLIDPALWLDHVLAGMKTYAFPAFLENCHLGLAGFGEEVVVQGALMIAADARSRKASGLASEAF